MAASTEQQFAGVLHNSGLSQRGGSSRAGECILEKTVECCRGDAWLLPRSSSLLACCTTRCCCRLICPSAAALLTAGGQGGRAGS